MSRPLAAPRQAGLGLDDPTRPVPTRPTLFHWLAGQADALRFDTLDALAAQAVELAGGCALRVAARPAVTAYPGLELFDAWSVYTLGEGRDDDWLCHVAMQATPREALVRALDAAAVARNRKAAA